VQGYTLVLLCDATCCQAPALLMTPLPVLTQTALVCHASHQQQADCQGQLAALQSCLENNYHGKLEQQRDQQRR
jgi:hypothetical protein